MNYTPNYHLPTWVKTDRIRMEDFNDMTAKLDAALNEHKLAITTKAEQRDLTALTTKVNNHTAQIAKLGNCQIYTTTYIGNGKYGANNKNTLTFPHKPLLVFLCESGRIVHLVNGCTTGYYQSGSSGYNSSVTWSGNTVTWSCSEGATGQMNNNYTYYVVALLVKE